VLVEMLNLKMNKGKKPIQLRNLAEEPEEK
jgi:hypothetical protein